MSSTTADKINYLLDTKEEIRQAIVEKYVDVPTSATFRSYANSIRAIPTGNKTCRFVIGTSTAGWTEKDCDYLCDGVDDQVEINAAIQALPSTGGEIKVLDGTYNITAPINIDKERVTFGGCGQSTIFKRMWKSSSDREGVIQFSTSYCTFKDFEIDGNKSVYAGGSGLCLTEINKTDILVEHVYSSNNKKYGIFLNYPQNSIVTNNTCRGNSNGIYTSNSKYCTITSNNCNDNILGIDTSNSRYCTITGNTCHNNIRGIDNTYTRYCTITGNTCGDNNYGIIFTSAKSCTVTGNTCFRGEGTSSDYTSSQDTIYIDSGTQNCVIVGNNCSGKAPTVAGTGNIVENNLS